MEKSSCCRSVMHWALVHCFSCFQKAERDLSTYLETPGGKDEQTDATNRATLAQWVAEKKTQYNNDQAFAAKKDAKYGSYPAWLEFTAANKLAAAQRTRSDTDALSGLEQISDGGLQVGYPNPNPSPNPNPNPGPGQFITTS